MSQNIIDFQGIKELLPHRYPFLLLDRVSDYVLEDWIEGYKLVSGNEEFFNGHFPDNQVMPGVLMVEACAQLSGVLILKSLQAQEGVTPPKYCYFAGIEAVRFKRMVVPGDRLDLRSEVTRVKSQLWKFAVQATVAGELACKAELMLIGGKE